MEESTSMNKDKRIAIIGASYLQLPLVLKANELGFKTFCFAYLEGAVCKNHCSSFYDISIINKEKILTVCESLNIDAVLSISSDVAVNTVNYIGTALRLICNSMDSTKITTHKYAMKECLMESKIKVANFILVTNLEDLIKVSELNYPVIVKPVDRSGSLGVTKISHDHELVPAYKKALKYALSKEVIIEEFIVGAEVSVEAISQEGKHTILAVTDKVTSGPPHFVELEHHQPSSLSKSTLKEIDGIVLSALDALQIKEGASHVELIISKEGQIYVNEIGARMGGDFIGSDLVYLSTGIDYLKAVLDVSLGTPLDLTITHQKYAGVIFRNNSNAEYFDTLSGKEDFIVRMEKDLKNASFPQKSGDRGNYFIYQSEKRINFGDVWID